MDKRKGGHIDNVDFLGYLGADVVLHALEQVRGNVEQKTEFLSALRAVKFETPLGMFEFDPRSQNVLGNLVLTQVKRADGEFGKFQNIVFKSFPRTQDPWWIDHPQGQ